jgi:hypothetical protein
VPGFYLHRYQIDVFAPLLRLLKDDWHFNLDFRRRHKRLLVFFGVLCEGRLANQVVYRESVCRGWRLLQQWLRCLLFWLSLVEEVVKSVYFGFLEHGFGPL